MGAKIFWPLSEPTTFYFKVYCPRHCCWAAPEPVPEQPSCCGSRQNLLHCSLGEPMNPLTEKHKYSKAALKKKKKVLKNNTGYSTALLFFFFYVALLREKGSPPRACRLHLDEDESQAGSGTHWKGKN